MQFFVNGFVEGLLLAIAALAFGVVYMSTHIFYIALAAIFVFVPSVAHYMIKIGVPWYISFIVSILIGLLMSSACELLNHRPLERKRASLGAHLISSLGIYMIIIQCVVLLWGNQTKSLVSSTNRSFAVGNFVIAEPQLVSATICVIIMGVFFWWVRNSSIGLKLRALSDNPVELSLRGYNIDSLRIFVFALSGFLFSIVSLLAAYDKGVDPYSGLPFFLLAVVSFIIGGRDSLYGPVLGGIIVGVVRSMTIWIFSAGWQDAITFLLLAVILFVKPGGIFGETRRLEAE